ncbi:Senescence associated protein 20, partial [Mucuna pruriens]
MGYNSSSTMKIIPGEAEKPSGATVEPEIQNRETVKMVYKALREGDTEKLAKVVRGELEWWYHGPPQRQHMMKVLTGESTHKDFKFRPRRIRAVGDRVMVEGWEGAGEYWVHVWTLKHGIIAQLREYFNTLLTVVLRVSEDGDEARLWRSNSRVRDHGSLPDLVLSI